MFREIIMENFGIMSLTFKDWAEKEESSKGTYNKLLIIVEGRKYKNLNYEIQRKR